MSFFGAIEFASRRPNTPQKKKQVPPTEASQDAPIEDKMDNITEDDTGVSYPLFYYRPESTTEAGEIHSVVTELDDFDPENPPKLMSITEAHWNFEKFQQLKIISSDGKRNQKYKTQSKKYEDFISDDMAYGVLSIHDGLMVLEEITHENMKSLKPVLSALPENIDTDITRRYTDPTSKPEERRKAVPQLPQICRGELEELHEQKMVELEEAVGFDVDAEDSENEIPQNKDHENPPHLSSDENSPDDKDRKR